MTAEEELEELGYPLSADMMVKLIKDRRRFLELMDELKSLLSKEHLRMAKWRNRCLTSRAHANRQAKQLRMNR